MRNSFTLLDSKPFLRISYRRDIGEIWRLKYNPINTAPEE